MSCIHVGEARDYYIAQVSQFLCPPSGKLMVHCLMARHIPLTGVPPIIKMDVASVFAITWDAMIDVAFRYWGVGVSKTCLAIAANVCHMAGLVASVWLTSIGLVQFDVTTVMSLSSLTTATLIIWVGFEEEAETKLLHLFAIVSTTPHYQNSGKLVSCNDLVHRSHPTLRYSCAFMCVILLVVRLVL